MFYPLAVTMVPVCLVLLYYLWIRNTRQTQVENIHRKCVFITGCDTGFGNALARRLDAMGVPVFAGCLTQKGAHDLKEKISERLQTVLVDVGSHESIQEAYQLVKECLSTESVIQRNAEARKTIARPDMTPVIDAYEHALFAKYPYDDYFPGFELIG